MPVNGKHNLLSVFIVLIFILSAIACKPTSQSELYGIYVADYDIAKEKLTLNEDGTFIQEVIFKSTNKVDVSKGRWTYNPQTDYVMFYENHMPVLDGFRKLNPDYNRLNVGPAFLPVDQYFGHTFLGTAEGVLYEKMDLK